MQWVDRLLPCGEVIATGRDVSAQYLAERQLAESEVRFRDLADHSADVVWRFRGEPRPHFDYMSPSVERVLGHPPEYFLEDFRRLLDMVDEDGRQLTSARCGARRCPIDATSATCATTAPS